MKTVLVFLFFLKAAELFSQPAPPPKPCEYIGIEILGWDPIMTNDASEDEVLVEVNGKFIMRKTAIPTEEGKFKKLANVLHAWELDRFNPVVNIRIKMEDEENIFINDHLGSVEFNLEAQFKPAIVLPNLIPTIVNGSPESAKYRYPKSPPPQINQIAFGIEMKRYQSHYILWVNFVYFTEKRPPYGRPCPVFH